MWELDYKESWAQKNWCFWTVVLEKTPENPLDCKEIQLVHPKGDQSWVFIGRTDVEAKFQHVATWCEELTRLKRPWCWERLRAGGEWDDRGWDGWIASPTQWTWVWVNSRSWWWTGRSGVLWFMGSQGVGHDWVTELNWTVPQYKIESLKFGGREASIALPWSSFHQFSISLEHATKSFLRLLLNTENFL